ncbi:helix-turn-helix transcriptional regulator [Labrenzia sp. OB1]|uniref:helix-turn-helix domain-containing protein n=1 Tax=Labrenzia sp. OB1 TaxID=1561204 RepID=UPI0009EF5173|nr:helix-turn-helix transcriptional regulator [Labrenzia sp. OB1]
MRLRDVRRSVGDLERDVFAKKLGLSANSLARYERGEREPSASVLKAYNSVFGASISWLITGEGEMFADAMKLPASSNLRTIDQTVFSQVGLLVIKVYKDESVKLPADVLLDEQASAYNALIKRAENPSDTEELLSLIPWLEARLRRSLKATAVAPETGQQQA